MNFLLQGAAVLASQLLATDEIKLPNLVYVILLFKFNKYEL